MITCSFSNETMQNSFYYQQIFVIEKVSTKQKAQKKRFHFLKMCTRIGLTGVLSIDSRITNFIMFRQKKIEVSLQSFE